MLTIINTNLFKIQTAIKEGKYGKRRVVRYSCPPTELENRNKKKEDGSYEKFQPYCIFQMEANAGNKGLTGMMRLDPLTTAKKQWPRASVTNKELKYDRDVVLIAMPYDGIISTVKSTPYARLMSGRVCNTPIKSISGPDTKNVRKHKTKNVLYLAIDVVTPKIIGAITEFNKANKDKPPVEYPQYTHGKQPEPSLRVGHDFCDILLFKTYHKATTKAGVKIYREQVRRLRARLVNDKLVFVVTDSESNTMDRPHIQPDKQSIIWERYTYPIKSATKPVKKPSSDKKPYKKDKLVSDKSDKFKDKPKFDKTKGDKPKKDFKKPYDKDKKDQGKTKFEKPNKDFKKPYDKDKKYPPKGKPTDNRTHENKDNKKDVKPKKQKKPQYNKHGILIQ